MLHRVSYIITDTTKYVECTLNVCRVCERGFSAAKILVSDYQSLLSKQIIEVLMILRYWLKAADII